MDRVKGKVALITGGASGLGRQAARRLAEEGARVVVTDLNEVGGAAVAEELGDSGLFVAHDVTKETDWVRVVQASLDKFGRLDVLVNSAGVGNMNSVEDCSLEEWQHVMSVNGDGVFLGCKHGIGAIKRTSTEPGAGGSIVNISSVSGLIGGHNLAAYNASKGAVRLLTKSVALHCSRQRYNIRCNSVHPTFIDTPMVRSMIDSADDPARVEQKLARQVPLGHIGEPDDIAWGIVYLASNESKFMTGAEFVVDGGITAM
ncbi:MAG: 3-beta-hydroxysteroid dehydrogenase [Alphaproteobacteria bacterium MarineAlpha9_Bin7]|nr:MAG: 3-beta-hydroxysteroid dehydrogenase [Alphaproteobacteria bacterium MarineAlpha9_Bin7]